MRYTLVVFDKNEDGEDKLVTPYLDKGHLYVNTKYNWWNRLMRHPRFIWVGIAGAVNRAHVALRDGWRPATDSDEVRASLPKYLTYFPNK